ncbi:MAG: SGNH/GDSL hydrolase family protein [Acutalibacteraceae bacterium]
MKRVLSIILCLIMIFPFTVAISADTDSNPKHIMVFGDSVMAGYSYAVRHSMGGLACGDQQFLTLLAQEYGLTYSSGDSMPSASGNWLINKAVSGSIISPSDMVSTQNTYINSQIEKITDDSYFKNSDVIIVDGGVNDIGDTYGVCLYRTLYSYMYGLDKDMNTCTVEEAKAEIERIKNLSAEEIQEESESKNITPIRQSWSDRRVTVKAGYQKVVDNLEAKGFTGTLYLQNNINAFSGSDNKPREYYWDAIIDYFITSVINDIITENSNAPFEIVLSDICGNCRDGYSYTGVNCTDSPVESIGDGLHLTYAGNQAVYKYLSKLINSDGNTMDVYTQAIPDSINYRTLYTADTIDFYRAIGADKVSVDELKGIIDDENETSILSNENVLKSNGAQKGITLNLSELDLSTVYGIKINYVSEQGDSVKTMIEISSKDADGNNKSLYFCGYNSANTAMSSKTILVNSPIGLPDYVYRTTQAKIADVQNIYQLTVYSTDSSDNYVDDTIYIDSIEVYTTLEQFQIDNITSEESPIISMYKGASMRIFSTMKDECGIRFSTKVDIERVNHIIDAGYSVELGTLIAPKDKINGELKFEDENNIHKSTTDYVVIPFDIEKGYYSDDYTQNCIVGSLVSIKEKNATRDFVGRGYLVYSKNGETTVEYADYYDSDISNNTRSINYLANCVKNDSEYYNSLSTAKQDNVNYWIDIVNN